MTGSTRRAWGVRLLQILASAAVLIALVRSADALGIGIGALIGTAAAT